MRIGVDGRSLVQPGARGIARYTHTLLSALASGFPDDEWRVLVPAGPRDPVIPGVRAVRVRAPGRVVYGLAGAVGRPRLDKLLGGVDVFWAPTPAPLAVTPGTPLVLSLHDLSWELRPADFTTYQRLWHRIARPRRLAARAARTVAVSDATRAQAIERWGLEPGRVLTIGEGLRMPDGPSAAATSGRVGSLSQPYFLSVGALEPRKAPDLLVRAHQRARSAGLVADLVIAGDGRLKPQLSGPGVHLLGHVSDAELDRLYAGALALVMPSRLEGFGLPPLEAALRGTPSIVSDLPAFHETLGDETMRVPVDDVAALANAMLELAGEAELRAELGARARDRARRFTPERAAAALYAVFTEVARRPANQL